jgi:hypothetical protein
VIGPLAHGLLVRTWRAIGAPPEDIDSAVGRVLARATDDAAELVWWLTVRAAARHQVALHREVRQTMREVDARFAAAEARARADAAEQEDRISTLIAEIRQAHGFMKAAQVWDTYRPTEGWRA